MESQLSSPSDLKLAEGAFRFVPSRNGGLEMWREPVEGELYVAGIDTSAGGAHSDLCSLSMVETRSRCLVAAWNGLYDPTMWGKMCARIGAYYNNAMLAFETHPSQHGLSACLAARDAGYGNIYRRQQQGMVTLRMTEELGWATTYKTKPLMIDRVRIALREKYEIPSEALLKQLLRAKLAAKTGEAEQVEFEGKDDFFTSYAIAQVVADIVGAQGYLTRGEEKPKSWHDQWWAHRKAQAEKTMTRSGPRQRLYDGA